MLNPLISKDPKVVIKKILPSNKDAEVYNLNKKKEEEREKERK